MKIQYVVTVTWAGALKNATLRRRHVIVQHYGFRVRIL